MAPELGAQEAPESRRPEALGRYEILQPLAHGGMAQLHLARFRSIEGFEKLAVIKRLKAEQAANQEIVQMFLSEVRLLANMQHPNIVHVYDVGEEGGAYYFAMEFLHGQDLRTINRKTGRRIPLDHALTVVTSVLAGLHYVHERRDASGESLGIVHRDVSPANIFITYDGAVKLLDFGIAKMERSQHTQAGVLKGKVRYMAPEQVNSDPIDRRSDVFAAGIVLWEVTTGKRLFTGRTDVEVLVQIASKEIPLPSKAKTNYPPDLERIVMKALSRNPAQRFQTAREMQQEIEAFAREQKLTLSPSNLEGYMGSVFEEEIDKWHEAERAGKALAEHVAEALPTAASVQSASALSGALSGSGSSQVSPHVAIEVEAMRRRWFFMAIAVLITLALMAALIVVVIGQSKSTSVATVPSQSGAPSVAPSAVLVAASAPTPATLTASAPVTGVAANPVATAPVRTPASPKWKPPPKRTAEPAQAATDTKPPPQPQTRPTWDKDSPLPPP